MILHETHVYPARINLPSILRIIIYNICQPILVRTTQDDTHLLGVILIIIHWWKTRYPHDSPIGWKKKLDMDSRDHDGYGASR